MIMKTTHTQFLLEEIAAATHLLEKSWKNPYREAYLEGKIYAYKKMLERETKSNYTKVDARDT